MIDERYSIYMIIKIKFNYDNKNNENMKNDDDDDDNHMNFKVNFMFIIPEDDRHMFIIPVS